MKTYFHNLAQSVKDLLGLIKPHVENNDIHVTTDDKEEWYRNSRLVTSGGTKNAFTLPIDELYDGLMITFIAGVSNLSETTTINGKPLLIPGNYSTPPRIIQGRPYTVWYSTTNIDYPDGAFFIKASATGDATAANVLAGKTFSNDSGTGLTGTMLDRSGLEIGSPWTNTNAGTKVSAKPGLNAYIDPNTVIAMHEPNLLPANILSGKFIFGVTGTASTGKRYASGTTMSGSGATVFTNSAGGGVAFATIQLPALAFAPTSIYVRRQVRNTLDATFVSTLYYYSEGSLAANAIMTQQGTKLNVSVTNNPLIPVLLNNQAYEWYAWE